MKFIINATTVSNTNEQLIKELQPIKHLFGGDWDEMVEAIRAKTEITHLKHISVTLQGGEWIVWVVAKEIDSDLQGLLSWLREEK